MDKDIINTIQQMLDQQKEDIEKEMKEQLNQQKDDIREEMKQQLKPINGRLHNLEGDVKVIKKDIKEIRFDLRSLKGASLELSEDTINHTHLLDDKETSRPIRDIS